MNGPDKGPNQESGMTEQLVFTRLLNDVLRAPANALLNAVHAPAQDPSAPINNTFAMEFLVFLFLLGLFLLVRSRLSVESPGGLQHLVELGHEFFDTQGHDIIGHGSEPFVPIVATLAYFILFANLIGLIPGFESPTADAVVPLGLALVTFFYYNWHGLRKQGPIGYAKHFMGPVWWLSPLMFIIEIISHLARAMSLTIRLYANIFAGDMVTLVFFSLIPLGLPIVFLGLHVFVSLLQAYIFALLATIYIAGAVAEEHH